VEVPVLTNNQIEEFKSRGFLNGGVFLNEETVEVLRGEVMRVIEERDRTDIPQPARIENVSHYAAERMDSEKGKQLWQIINIWQGSQHFYERLVGNKEIAKAVAQLTDASELRVWHDQIQYKPPQLGGIQMWHQDAPLWPVIEPMTEVSAWIALDDVDYENGCMSMVPSSHRWGDGQSFLDTVPDYESLPSTYQGHQVEAVVCPVKKGEVHFHHALTWHGSHSNTSTRHRRALAIHYMTESTRFVASGDHVIKHLIEVAGGAKMEGQHFPQVYP
jgi:phytanoyl-CoA hydroxylase